MTIHVFGGGTVTYVRNHLALCAPAAGTTARVLAQMLGAGGAVDCAMPVVLHETRMANPSSRMESNDDVRQRLEEVLSMRDTRAVIFNVALCDFDGSIGDVPSGKYAERLQTREIEQEGLSMTLRPTPKLLGRVHALRPDVLSVGFKTTADASSAVQVQRANRMASQHTLNLVLANDTVTRNNLVLPGGGNAVLTDALFMGTDRSQALQVLARAVRRGLA